MDSIHGMLLEKIQVTCFIIIALNGELLDIFLQSDAEILGKFAWDARHVGNLEQLIPPHGFPWLLGDALRTIKWFLNPNWYNIKTTRSDVAGSGAPLQFTIRNGAKLDSNSWGGSHVGSRMDRTHDRRSLSN
jgi:hypothetical protein